MPETTDWQHEWSQFESVSRAMTRLEPYINFTDESEVETILRLLWDDGCAWGYNYG